jgi:hypothetical protein
MDIVARAGKLGKVLSQFDNTFPKPICHFGRDPHMAGSRTEGVRNVCLRGFDCGFG